MSKSDSDLFYLNYGKAMSAWADLEMALCDWFRRAIEPDNHKGTNAEGIFYSARSFNGRADMLKAAADSTNISPDQRTFIRKSIKRASDYNTFRAKLAHRVTVETSGYGNPKDGMYLREGNDTSGRAEHMPSIDLNDLINATTHFDALQWVILIADIPGGISLEEGLQLIDRLPKSPNLPADNRLIKEIYAE